MLAAVPLLQALKRGKVLRAQTQKGFFYRKNINELSAETSLHSSTGPCIYIDISQYAVMFCFGVLGERSCLYFI